MIMSIILLMIFAQFIFTAIFSVFESQNDNWNIFGLQFTSKEPKLFPMSSERQIKNLALIGFMGSGKTTVGQHLAFALRFQFVDTDQLIERRTGKTVTEIFKTHGEAHFRDLERQIVRELVESSGTVIATGGGLPCHFDNLERLKEKAFVVCLWASPEKLYERVKHQSHRPLLNDPDPLGTIRRLLSDREPYYRQADLLVNVETRTTREIVQIILHEFNLLNMKKLPSG